MAREVVIPYAPRKVQREIHKALDAYRFCVIVAHRRLGKTVCAVIHLILQAIGCKRRAGRYAYIAPLRNQAKIIAWSYLKYFTGRIPGVKVNETELSITLPNGAEIRIYGADNPDALRGGYFDGVVMDEVAQMKPDVWGEIVRPALADRQGFAVFIGTPKGMNLFHELYQRALTSEGWFAGVWRVDQTKVISEEELADIRKDLTVGQYRQEFLCDFSASSDDVFITIDLVDEASRRIITARDVMGAEMVIGVDPARYGGDSTVITPRRGLFMYDQTVLQGLDNMEVADRVVGFIHQYDPDGVCIDAGAGAGVIDRLKHLGYRDIVLEINFGGSPVDDKVYFNKRAEMYGKTRDWLRNGGRIPDNADLKTELTVTRFGYDEKSRIKLEKKDAIKTRTGKSPDRADSAVVTFGADIRPRGLRARREVEFAQQGDASYDPLY